MTINIGDRVHLIDLFWAADDNNRHTAKGGVAGEVISSPFPGQSMVKWDDDTGTQSVATRNLELADEPGDRVLEETFAMLNGRKDAAISRIHTEALNITRAEKVIDDQNKIVDEVDALIAKLTGLTKPAPTVIEFKRGDIVKLINGDVRYRVIDPQPGQAKVRVESLATGYVFSVLKSELVKE